MESSFCGSCQKPKAPVVCGLCNIAICKKCVQVVQEGSFSFLKHIPEYLEQGTYCPACFDEKIGPELRSYEDTLERAKRVSVFYKKQSKETRLFRRTDPIKVENCADKDETLLRLAFFAVQGNFNTLVDVVISSEKVRYAGYQTSRWQGVGFPVQKDQ